MTRIFRNMLQCLHFVHSPFFAKKFTDYFFDTVLSQVIKLECVFWSLFIISHSKDIITLPDIYPVTLFRDGIKVKTPNKLDTVIFVINVFTLRLFYTNVFAPLHQYEQIEIVTESSPSADFAPPQIYRLIPQGFIPFLKGAIRYPRKLSMIVRRVGFGPTE